MMIKGRPDKALLRSLGILARGVRRGRKDFWQRFYQVDETRADEVECEPGPGRALEIGWCIMDC